MKVRRIVQKTKTGTRITYVPVGKATIISRRSCGAVTDRELFRGKGTLLDQFGDDAIGRKELKEYVANAKQAGGKPHYTDLYIPGLADFPGDPRAFVPASEGRGHIRRQCEARDRECNGLVNVKRSFREPIAANG